MNQILSWEGKKQINYIFHFADATKVEEYINLDLFSISNLDFFLILLSRLIAKKEYCYINVYFSENEWKFYEKLFT